MTFGGGRFLAQNRGLPGTYINFVSVASGAVSQAERGYVAIALPLPWGPLGEMLTVTAEDLIRRSRRLFGREYTHPELRPLRELFLGARTLYLYRLGEGGERASCNLGTAKHPGSLGNDILLVVTDLAGKFGVETLVGGVRMDYQMVSSARELAANDFVQFDRESVLIPTAGIPLEGGSDGTPGIDEYSRFLEISEGYAFNVLGCPSQEDKIKGMFARHTRRMREEAGVKFQCVLYRYTQADFEGVISVENACEEEESGLVYWVTGMSAGCPVNRSITNRRYTGEFSVDTAHSKAELERKLQGGSFLLFGTGRDIRVVEDVNTLVTYTPERSADFSLNQTIRVIDQVAVDIAALFRERYLGLIPNDNAGRLSLWSDIVSHHRNLETIRAIEDFEPQDVVVEPGENKRSVVVTDRITPVCAMSQLYMTVVVQ